MSSFSTGVEGYLHHRLFAAGGSLASDATAPTILRELASSIIPSGNDIFWKRRPSISDDGTPVVLSWKAAHENDESIRILVESGTLQMTVAEQISYSLTKLDVLLGLLDWRTAASGINAIVKQVLPEDPSEIVRWRGGIWLGAEVKSDLSETELRLYLNLRHGEHSVRWQRLLHLISSFSSDTINPFLDEWKHTASLFAIPVGLGVVVSDGYVKGIRAYLSIETPTVTSIEAVIRMERDGSSHRVLSSVYNSFTSVFGEMPQHSVTIGSDFFYGAKKPYRMKADFCCHLIPFDLVPHLLPWVKEHLVKWSLEPALLQNFMENINMFWAGSQIQFLSLGFTDKFEHVTVYVKPTA